MAPRDFSSFDACQIQVAYHEAGHALVAHLFDRPCLLATIRPVGETLGHVIPPRLRPLPINPRLPSEERAVLRHRLHQGVLSEALISLGGVAAESVWRRTEPAQLSRWLVVMPQTDRECAQYHLKMLWYLNTDYRAQLSEEGVRRVLERGLCIAQRLLTVNRVALDAVALELLRRESLQRRELCRLFERDIRAVRVARALDPRELFESAADDVPSPPGMT